MFLGQEQMDGAFLCDGCRATRDQACDRCTEWTRLMAEQPAVGPKLLEKVRQLARYVEAKIQVREREQAKIPADAADEPEPGPDVEPAPESEPEVEPELETQVQHVPPPAAAPAVAKAEVLLTFDGSIRSPEGSAERHSAVDAVKTAVMDFLIDLVHSDDIELSTVDEPESATLVRTGPAGDGSGVGGAVPMLTVALTLNDPQTIAWVLDETAPEDPRRLERSIALLMAGVTADSIMVTIEAGSVRLTVGGLPLWAAAAMASGSEAADGQLARRLHAALAGCCTLAPSPPAVALDLAQIYGQQEIEAEVSEHEVSAAAALAKAKAFGGGWAGGGGGGDDPARVATRADLFRRLGEEHGFDLTTFFADPAFAAFEPSVGADTARQCACPNMFFPTCWNHHQICADLMADIEP